MPLLVAPAVDTGSTLHLCSVWLNSAADLSDCVAFTYVTGLSPTDSVSAEVRTMVNGRRRVVVSAGGRVSQSYVWKLEYNTRDQIDWLRGHVGDLVCVRDHKGRKFYAIYTDVPVEESTFWRDRGDVTLTLSEVTHAEVAL